MGIRHWLKKRLAEQNDDGDEGSAPSGSIISAIFGRQPPTLHALGEFDQTTYPGELQDLLRRREDVAEELREMDLTTRQARIDAIPRLHHMLRTYPHPLAYEVLIHAYVDAGRWDEARGAAFAARERRTQVSRSPYSEIRAEIDRLKEWTPEEVELVRQEREGSPAYVPPAAPPKRPAEPELAEVSRPVAAAEPVRTPEPAEPVRAPEPVAVAEPAPEPVAIAEPIATEPVSSAEFEEPVDSAELRASADSADRTESADADGMTEPTDSAEMGEPMGSDEAGDAEPGEPASGVAAAGSGGGGGSRPGGKKGRSRGKRRRK
jgi:hypothetical protein